MGEQNILLKKTQKPSYVQRAYDGIRNLIIEEEISRRAFKRESAGSVSQYEPDTCQRSDTPSSG